MKCYQCIAEGLSRALLSKSSAIHDDVQRTSFGSAIVSINGVLTLSTH